LEFEEEAAAGAGTVPERAHFSFLTIKRISLEMGRTGASPVPLGVSPSADFHKTIKKVKCALPEKSGRLLLARSRRV
jgi:hypothetical protein